MRTRLLILGLSLAFLIGCSGSKPPTLGEVNNTNIKKVRGAYGMFLILHGLNGPKDEETFKEFLKTDKGAGVKLGRMGISQDQVDEMFISERDGEPFKIRYGLVGRGDYPIVFESKGVDGKRFVAFLTPREVDAQEYEVLWKKKIKDFSMGGAGESL